MQGRIQDVSEGVGVELWVDGFEQIAVLTLRIRLDRSDLALSSRKHAYIIVLPLNPTFVL